MKTLKAFFLYTGILTALILSASSVSRAGNDKVKVWGSENAQKAKNWRHHGRADSQGYGSGKGTEGSNLSNNQKAEDLRNHGRADFDGESSNNVIGWTDTTHAGNAPAAATPEPISMLLFSTGLIGVGFAARRRRLAAKS